MIMGNDRSDTQGNKGHQRATGTPTKTLGIVGGTGTWMKR
jgi:hypothetical protein